METRAISYEKGKLRFFIYDGSWKDFLTRKPVSDFGDSVIYGCNKRDDLKDGMLRTGSALSRKELSDKLAEFFVSVRSFSDNGTTKIPEDIRLFLRSIGEVTKVPLHHPSIRILKASIAQYDSLLKMGMPSEGAQSYAVRVAIDQICYGKFGQRTIGTETVYDAVLGMAQFYRLLNKNRQTTDFT